MWLCWGRRRGEPPRVVVELEEWDCTLGLPPELFERILGFMSVPVLVACMRVNWAWYHAARKRARLHLDATCIASIVRVECSIPRCWSNKTVVVSQAVTGKLLTDRIRVGFAKFYKDSRPTHLTLSETWPNPRTTYYTLVCLSWVTHVDITHLLSANIHSFVTYYWNALKRLKHLRMIPTRYGDVLQVLQGFPQLQTLEMEPRDASRIYQVDFTGTKVTRLVIRRFMPMLTVHGTNRISRLEIRLDDSNRLFLENYDALKLIQRAAGSLTHLVLENIIVGRSMMDAIAGCRALQLLELLKPVIYGPNRNRNDPFTFDTPRIRLLMMLAKLGSLRLRTDDTHIAVNMMERWKTSRSGSIYTIQVGVEARPLCREIHI